MQFNLAVVYCGELVSYKGVENAFGASQRFQVKSSRQFLFCRGLQTSSIYNCPNVPASCVIQYPTWEAL